MIPRDLKGVLNLGPNTVKIGKNNLSIFITVHTEKSFLNLVKSNPIWIVNTLFFQIDLSHSKRNSVMGAKLVIEKCKL